MHQTILLLSLIFCSFRTIGQTPLEVLIGKSDDEVSSYLQTLISKSENANNLKIDRNEDDGGDLILVLDLPSDEENKFTCYAIFTKFIRINGKEICYTESILGTNANAINNLNFVKDNYTNLSSGVWTRPYASPKFQIEASFKRDNNGYMLTYLLKEIK